MARQRSLGTGSVRAPRARSMRRSLELREQLERGNGAELDPAWAWEATSPRPGRPLPVAPERDPELPS